MILMEEKHRDPDQSPKKATVGSSRLEGAVAAAYDLIDHGGVSRNTFLAKREC